MSQWVVPNWNGQPPHHQTSPQSQQGDHNRSSSNVHFSNKTPSFSHNFVSMPKYEAMELTWGQSDDTLESIVHSSLSKKRTRSNPECKDETLMSWASLESHRSLKTKNSIEDLAPDDGSDEEHNMKRKTDGSCSTRQTRVAIHNQSERRRRDRINQKMKDLQKLVPNGSKTDRASLLDDTIQYLKQLQAQVQFMCSIRSSVPQMVMPLGIQQQQQQQLQMLLLAARMGLLDTDSMASNFSSAFPCAAAFAPPPVLVPSIISTTKPKPNNLPTSAFVPPTDPFCTFLAQSMDMDLYSKMVTLYCQEVNKTPQQTSKLIQSQRIEGIKEDMH